jgi:NADPH:quinone reductase-like Zn-dependent oxidoreductase
MRAIIYRRYGSADVLEPAEVAAPEPRDNEVLIRIHAVSINEWDWGLLQGRPFVNRMLNGLRRPKQTILGSDVAGCVEAVGRGVDRFVPGDRVFGDLSGRWGGFAEHVCAPQTALAMMPACMGFAEAAAIPQAAMLALQGLRDKGRIRAGQKVLINGAGGGVGSFALQLARLHDVELTGVDSADKFELLRSLGCSRVIDYRREDFTRLGSRFDLILDVKSDRSPLAYLRALARHGTYVTVGGELPRLLQFLLLGPLIALGSSKALRIVSLQPNRDLAYLSERFEAGELRPVIERFDGLDAIPRAMHHYASGKHLGKVVIVLRTEAGQPLVA